MLVSGQVGPSFLGDGVSTQPFRQDRSGAVVMQELHGRFYEQNFRGSLYSIGGSVTALSANTITLINTSTPIVGVWNPSTNNVNLVILQLVVNAFINTLTTPVGFGAIVLASSVGNTAISTGSAPLNRKTLVNSGSSAKGFPGGVALTGLTNNVVIFEGIEVPPAGPLTYGTITAPTATGNSLTGVTGVVNFDGSLIIPPGGVLSVLNTTSTTTMSATARLLWEEVPIV